MAVRTSFTAGEVLAAADLTDTFGAKLNVAGGKVLQVVRATDATNRTTTSTSFVDASISVTITPQTNTSAVILIWTFIGEKGAASEFLRFRITDSSNNAISGGDDGLMGSTVANQTNAVQTQIAYATPATTSAITFKGQFRSNNGTSVLLVNSAAGSQLYAIEVSA